MKRLFIDTNILIDFSKGYDELLKNLFKKQIRKELELCINSIVVAEFTTDNKLQSSQLLDKAESFLLSFTIFPITARLGFTAGRLLREKQVDYLGDGIIAATCLEHNLELVTRNKKHFRNVLGLKYI